MRLACTASAIVIALALSPSIARADDTVPAPALDRPAPATTTLTRSLDAAFAFWAARGVSPCPRTSLSVRLYAPTGELADTSGLAIVGGCIVWLSDTSWNLATGVRRTSEARDQQRVARREFCALVIHELGHSAGLDHSSPDPQMVPGYAEPPRVCAAAFPTPRRAIGT